MSETAKPPIWDVVKPPDRVPEVFAVTDEQMKEYTKDYFLRRKELINAAALARGHGVSYRNFQVGCGIMTKYRGDESGEYQVFTAHNFTPVKGNWKGAEKRCAERNAIEGALDRGSPFIVAITTVSREKSTGDETRAHDALHPCRDCRDMMRDLKERGILRGDSIVCNVNDAPQESKNVTCAEEEMTVDQLLELYHDDEKTPSGGIIRCQSFWRAKPLFRDMSRKLNAFYDRDRERKKI